MKRWIVPALIVLVMVAGVLAVRDRKRQGERDEAAEIKATTARIRADVEARGPRWWCLGAECVIGRDRCEATRDATREATNPCAEVPTAWCFRAPALRCLSSLSACSNDRGNFPDAVTACRETSALDGAGQATPR